jgi:hypothetical protein
MESGNIYYKYRSLDSWRFLLDIFLNKRLYAAPYATLNDPMEGQNYYVGNRIGGNVRSAIAAQTKEWNICSLTRDPKQSLMWAYYASGHRGLALGVRVVSPDRNQYVLREVHYDSRVYVTPDEAKCPPNELALAILFRKQHLWGHEREWRALTRGQYISISIEEVHLGSLITDPDRQLVSQLVKATAPLARLHKVRRASLV